MVATALKAANGVGTVVVTPTIASGTLINICDKDVLLALS